MRPLLALVSVVALCRLASAAPKDTPPQALFEHAKLLEPIKVESVALTPIISTDPKIADDNLLVLDEAMPKKLVRIQEKDGGDVNNLTLTNKADRPLFL